MEDYMVFQEDGDYEICDRNYVPIPLEYYKEMRHLSAAEFGELVRMILYFNLTGKVPKAEGILLHYVDRVMETQNRFNKGWNQVKEARKEAGRKGAAIRRERDSKAEQKVAKLSKAKQTKTETETKIETETLNQSQSQKIAGRNIDHCLLPTAETESPVDPVQSVTMAMRRLLSMKISKTCLTEIREYVARLGADTCIYAVERAADESQCSWKYVRGILKDLEQKGISSRSQAESDRNRFIQPPTSRQNTGHVSQYQTHENTTLSELERMAIAQALAEED